MHIFWHFCSAGLLLMMSGHGESHSTIFWSVKVSSLIYLLLSLFCQTLLSQFSILPFHSGNSLLLGPAYHLELPSGFFRSIEDIFFLQVHQIHLEIYLRRMTLAEIRGLIWAASVDGAITARPYSFIKPALTDGFAPDHIPGLYLKMTKGGRWVLSLCVSAVCPLSLLYWNEFSWCVIFQPVVSCVKINCPPEDKFCLASQLLHFPLKKWHIWQIGKQSQKNK